MSASTIHPISKKTPEILGQIQGLPHRQLGADLLDDGEDDHGADGVGDEGGRDEHERAEDGEQRPHPCS